MATQEIVLTESWQLVTADSFIGQCRQNKTIHVHNADALPDAGVTAMHSVVETENLSFGSPKSGSWYAKISSIDINTPTVLTYTEML